MEAFLSVVEKVNACVNRIVWGPGMLLLIMLVGVQFTVRTGFFQLTHFKLWIKSTLGSLFGARRRKESEKSKKNSAISPFQAVATALAGAIGTGNIVGVATALTLGGPGAVFWMWAAALFGMMTIFAENILGVKYRRKNKKGEWAGGPMYYIEYGLHQKWLAAVFAVACILASFGMGNMAQANSIAGALRESFGVAEKSTGLVLAVLTGIIIFGGIGRIASVTEKIVPFMAIFYMAGALIVVFANVSRVPQVLQEILRQAFDCRAAAGGVGGVAVSAAVRYGIARGVFSNEAGLGSSPIVHAAADTARPVTQGMWGIFQVFLDTIVMCTITALCILTSGAMETGKDGAALSTAAFTTVFGGFGGIFVAVSILLFAFATIIGWSYYGERSMEYLGGEKAVPFYRAAYIIAAALGCVLDLRLVWSVADTFNGLMAIPNLAALLLLSGEVVQEERSYIKKK